MSCPVFAFASLMIVQSSKWLFSNSLFLSRPCPSGKSGHGQKISDRTIYTICRWACIVIDCLRHYVLQCMDTITGFSCASCPVLFTSPERIIRKWCALLRANVSDLLIYEFCPMHYTVAFWHYFPPVKLHYWIFDTVRHDTARPLFSQSSKLCSGFGLSPRPREFFYWLFFVIDVLRYIPIVFQHPLKFAHVQTVPALKSLTLFSSFLLRV